MGSDGVLPLWYLYLNHRRLHLRLLLQGAALSDLADSMQQRAPLDPAQAALIDPDIEQKRAAAAAAAWGAAAPAAAAAAPPPAPAAPAPAQPRAVEAMSVEELEAELMRRKAGQVPQQLSADD